MSDLRKQLEIFLSERGRDKEIVQLTPDASTREYYRIRWNDATAIACVYPEALVATEHPFLDSTDLFLAAGLPVARIYDFEAALGVIIQEDFGDEILRERMWKCAEDEREKYLITAIDLIAGIQAATELAKNRGAIASRLSFDFAKLSWELDFFVEHYFTTLKKAPLDNTLSIAFKLELDTVARELESMVAVLTHRDFHAANLMVASDGTLKIIDHQDARMGSPAYDLVSLLLDRVTEAPSPAWLAEKRRALIERRAAHGLPALEEEAFAAEFSLQTIQRCLKAIGTFSYQSAVRGKKHFLPFIRPMFEIVLGAAQNLDRFPAIQSVITAELQRN